MLVLSRKLEEQIVIGDRITITVLAVRGNRVKLGIHCPADIPVHRKEVAESIHRSMSAVNSEVLCLQ